MAARTQLTRLLPQPLTGIGTLVTGGGVLLWSWQVNDTAGRLPASLPALPLLLSLVGAVILAYRFPIHVRPDTRVYVASVPLFLLAVLLPPPLAAAAIGLGKFGGDMMVRGQTGAYLSDIASQAGRWVLVGFGGSAIAHVPASMALWQGIPLLGAATVLWLGDILTSPLVLSPISQEHPLPVIRGVLHEAGSAEAAQYLVAVLGALAAQQQLWSLPLLTLPVALVYRAFKSAKDMHESTRQLLASVIETSPDAILLLDLDGTVRMTNGQGTRYCGELRDRGPARHIAELVRPDDRERLETDLRSTVETGRSRTAEYTLARPDGETAVVEAIWSLVADRRGQPRAVTLVAHDVTNRRLEAEQLRYEALHDALTGLPNRALLRARLEEQLARQREREGSFAVFLLDLNRFKQANDTYGHQAGDEILRHVAARLQNAVRDSDTVARLGGDEFVLLLPRADREGAIIVATRVLEAIATPIPYEGQVLDVGTSIGIALYPDCGRDAESLLAAADAAMYEAKRARQHRGSYHFASTCTTVPELPAAG